MTRDADAGDVPILIGSGPAGVAVAAALVAANRPFIWIDAAGDETKIEPPQETLAEIRQNPEALRRLFFGRNLESLSAVEELSPKLRAPSLHPVFADFIRNHPMSAENFELVGSYSHGGLSNAWGAMAVPYGRDDLPLPDALWREIRQVTLDIAAEIGISGELDAEAGEAFGAALPLQAPLPLHPTAAHVWTAYRPEHAAKVRLSRPLQAVLSAPKGDRAACDLRQMCLWGCGTKAVYSARFDFETLRARDGVRYLPGMRALRIERDAPLYEVICRAADGSLATVESPRVIVAAGALTSTALALDCAGFRGDPIPIGITPAFAFAVLVPRKMGSAPVDTGYAMAQLAWSIGERRDLVCGALYATDGIPATEIIQRLPLSRRGGRAFAIWALPAMLLGSGFLPGEYGCCEARITRVDGEAGLAISGGVRPGTAGKIGATIATLRSALLRCGALLLPGSVQSTTPGADVHYGATLPMLGTGPLATDSLGQLAGMPRLHVVDGAILPRLSSRHPTLTIMANARRIGRAIAVG